MSRHTFTRSVKSGGNSKVIRIPAYFIRQGLVEEGQEYRVTLTPVKEGEDHEPSKPKAST